MSHNKNNVEYECTWPEMSTLSIILKAGNTHLTLYSTYVIPSEHLPKCGGKTSLNKIIKDQILRSPLAFLLAQLVNNVPAVQETPDGFLGQENSLEKG